MNKIKKLLILVSLMVVCVSLPAEPTAAQSGTILNLSGRQRMLSQKMTKELMFAALGHNVAANLTSAQATVALFDETLKGLRDGSEALGLPPTEDPRILRQIGKVVELWDEYRGAVDGIIAKGSVEAGDVARIAELNLPLLAEMNKCVTLYERQARGSSMSANPALAVAVNLSGKQRMLSQRMTKEMLLVAYGHEAEENKLRLTESYDLFDRTLKGLEHGDAALELSADVNSPELIKQLHVVAEIWSQYFPLARAAASGEFDAAQLASIEALNLTLLKEMNRAVGMYEALTL